MTNPTIKIKTSQADLNQAQLEAVTHEGGPLLIVAGAGTGKTAVITRRIAWLVLEKGLRPEEILALTFTDKAAGEMEERVDRLLPYGYGKLYISTFHSFAEEILRRHALDIGLSPDFKLLDPTGQWMLVRKNLGRFPLKYYRPLGTPTKFIHALLQHFGRAKDELIVPEEYLAYAQNLKLDRDSELIVGGAAVPGEFRQDEILRIEEAANAYHVYEQLLLEEGAMDFGGLISRLIDLFKKRPRILHSYREQFKHILVDEFQDTNHAQYELVKMLAAPKNNLAAVADDDQSIYAFRGAAISNVLKFKDDFPDCREIFLTKNYRSCQNILDLAYNFIKQNNPNRLEVRLSGSGLSKRLSAAGKRKGIIRHLHNSDGDSEARRVRDAILALMEKDPSLIWNDFAILVRANDHAGAFIRVLDEARIPYTLVSPRGLYTRPVIMDLIAYLRVLVDQHDSPGMYRILTSPISNLTQNEVSQILYWANRKAWSLFHTLRQAPLLKFGVETVCEAARIADMIMKHSALAARVPASRVVYSALEDSGYLKKLASADNEEHRRALAHLNSFYKKVSNFEAQSMTKMLKEFLEILDMEIRSGETGALPVDASEGPESVKIMTCHAAKGLEFEFVFAANMVDRRFPTSERRDAIELPDALVKEIITGGDFHLEEERRLFYVACTRAKQGLFFTSADDYGGARKKKLSRFLLELEALGLLKLGTAADKEKIRRAARSAEPKEHLPENPLPAHFSFTQLKAFDTCPLQYKFAHILKIPIRGKPQFSFGKTIHSVLQKFCERVKEQEAAMQGNLFGEDGVSVKAEQAAVPVSLEELFKLYDERWIDDWYDDESKKKEYYEKGRDILRNFYEYSSKNPPSPAYIEQAFSLKMGDYTIRGTIDRADRTLDGKLDIIDYKTGRSRELAALKKSGMSEQLLIYQLAAEEVFGEKVNSLMFYFVEDGSQVKFLGTSEELAKFKDKIQKQIQEMKQSSFPATPAKQKCEHCDFNSICPSRVF